MAAGIINLQKASGGITKISSADGTGVTELVVPESGELVNKDYVDTQNGQNVKLTGNQTIAGVKTFSSSPIVPTPTSGTQVANKDYVDLKVALASFVGTNQSLSANGYQKLPGGLFLQWGNGNSGANTTARINFPIAFPNAGFSVLGVDASSGTINAVAIQNITTTGFDVASSNGSPIYYIAIGY